MINLEVNVQVKASSRAIPGLSGANMVALFKKVARAVSVTMKVKKFFPISLALVSSSEMKKINFRYRGSKKATDVLSFEELNEILICIDTANHQAKENKRTLKNELCVLFIHGCLHLLGYEDETKTGDRNMDLLGKKIFSKII